MRLQVALAIAGPLFPELVLATSLRMGPLLYEWGPWCAKCMCCFIDGRLRESRLCRLSGEST